MFGVVYTGVFMVKFEQDVNDLSKFWYCALSLTQRLEPVATHTHHMRRARVVRLVL